MKQKKNKWLISNCTKTKRKRNQEKKRIFCYLEIIFFLSVFKRTRNKDELSIKRFEREYLCMLCESMCNFTVLLGWFLSIAFVFFSKFLFLFFFLLVVLPLNYFNKIIIMVSNMNAYNLVIYLRILHNSNRSHLDHIDKLAITKRKNNNNN